jgi:hypothetical protein
MEDSHCVIGATARHVSYCCLFFDGLKNLSLAHLDVLGRIQFKLIPLFFLKLFLLIDEFLIDVCDHIHERRAEP